MAPPITNKKYQWLWLIGLYVAGIFVLGLIAGAARWLLNNSGVIAH